jgi:Rps23 Pro-64 3,4-dihydroxylase Tpa1-like proline 4-hydroxylase
MKSCPLTSEGMAKKKKQQQAQPSKSAWVLHAAFAAACIAFLTAYYLRRSTEGGSNPGSNKLTSMPCNAQSYKRGSSCSPHDTHRCGRMVVDNFASAEEVAALQAIAEHGMQLGGGSGGPTILDLVSGALSYGDKFIDVWAAFDDTKGVRAYRRSELQVFQQVIERVSRLVKDTFAVEDVYLTSPGFFSRIKAAPAQIANDEYWHRHVDTEQYESFVYTALLYLTNHGIDFEGGQLQFLQTHPETSTQTLETVNPAKGRLVLFTSGAEHPHRVMRVTNGTRLTVTIPFTCDRRAAVDVLSRAIPD